MDFWCRQSFFCHMVLCSSVLFPAMLIAIILNHSFSFIKLYSPELFVCYLICYRNLPPCLFAMTSLTSKHTYMCRITFLDHPLISCDYPFSFFLRAAKLHNYHSIASLQLYSFIRFLTSLTDLFSLKVWVNFSFIFNLL